MKPAPVGYFAKPHNDFARSGLLCHRLTSEGSSYQHVYPLSWIGIKYRSAWKDERWLYVCFEIPA